MYAYRNASDNGKGGARSAPKHLKPTPCAHVVDDVAGWSPLLRLEYRVAQVAQLQDHRCVLPYQHVLLPPGAGYRLLLARSQYVRMRAALVAVILL